MEGNIKTVVKPKGLRLLAEWSKLRVVSSGVVLQTWWRNFEFHNRLGVYLISDRLLGCESVICCTKSVKKLSCLWLNI